MPESLLCIHIEHNKLAATVTEATGQVIELLDSVHTEIEGSLEMSFEKLLNQLDTIPTRSIVSLSHNSLGFHTLNFPFQDRKKINQILQHELEEQTSHQLDDYFTDFFINKQSDKTSKVVISLIEKTPLLDTLSTMQLAGIDPELICIAGINGCRLNCKPENEQQGQACCYIYIASSTITISISQADQLILVRQIYHQADKNHIPSAKELAQQIKQTLLGLQSSQITSLRFLVSGNVEKSLKKSLESELQQKIEIFSAIKQPFIKVLPDIRAKYEDTNTHEALCQAINYHQKNRPFFNFRSGALAKKRHKLQKPKLLMLTTAVFLPLLLCVCVWAWIDYSAMEKKRDSLKAERDAIFRQTLPEVKRVVNPIQQLKVRLNQTQNNGGTVNHHAKSSILELITELSVTITPQYNVTLTRLIAEQNNVRLKGTAKDFNTVDAIQKVLSKRDYFSSVTINSANLNSNKDRVIFELKLAIGDQP